MQVLQIVAKKKLIANCWTNILKFCTQKSGQFFLLSVLVDRERCSESGLSRVALVIQVVQVVSLDDMHSDKNGKVSFN